jgi:hypothetical protein
MGTTLGVLCAGLLLISDAPDLIDHPASLLARFVFLVSVGLSFGLGASMTGAMFHTNDDKPQS